MNCKEIPNKLKLFLEDNLSPQELGELHIHLNKCRECAQKYLTEKLLISSIVEAKEEKEKIKLESEKILFLLKKEEQKRKKEWKAIMVAAAVFVFLVGFLWQFSSPEFVKKGNVIAYQKDKEISQFSNLVVEGEKLELFKEGRLTDKISPLTSLYSFENLKIKNDFYSIYLQKGSNLIFVDKRTLLFRFGKANFSFQKGAFKSFYIDTKNGNILITGTRLSLFQKSVDDNETEVKLSEGSIIILHKKGKKYSFSAPADIIINIAGVIRKSEEKVNNYSSKKNFEKNSSFHGKKSISPTISLEPSSK